MRRYTILICISFLLSSLMAVAQVSTFSKQYIDTLRQGRPTAGLYLGFYFLEDARTYLYLNSTVTGLICDSRNQHEIMGIINYQGLTERSTSNTGYLYLHSNLFRHRVINGKRRLGKISLEPFALYQFDEDRGINARFQVGAYAVPLILNRPKIRIQAGVGMLYQWDRYDLLPPDYDGWWLDDEWSIISENIRDMDTDGSGFVHRNGLRASAYLGFYSTFGKIFDWNLILICQQPFSSSFTGTSLYSISSDFRTPYPCITLETAMNFKLLSWLAMDLRYYFQHDRNQLTFYLPYYMYYITMGVYFTI